MVQLLKSRCEISLSWLIWKVLFFYMNYQNILKSVFVSGYHLRDKGRCRCCWSRQQVSRKIRSAEGDTERIASLARLLRNALRKENNNFPSAESNAANCPAVTKALNIFWFLSVCLLLSIYIYFIIFASWPTSCSSRHRSCRRSSSSSSSSVSIYDVLNYVRRL